MSRAMIVEDLDVRYPMSWRLTPKRAVRQATFSVAQGSIHGFLGENGAGKSSTIKALTGQVRAKGRIQILGQGVYRGKPSQQVGYSPERPQLFSHLTGAESLRLAATLRGFSRRDGANEADRLLEEMGLAKAANHRIFTYSKGMTQRLAVAHALACMPPVLILDEPLSGLDPVGRRIVREAIIRYAETGRTVFWSSHILPDIQDVCDSVTLISQGKIRASGALVDLLGSQRLMRIELRREETLDPKWEEYVRLRTVAMLVLELPLTGGLEFLRSVKEPARSIVRVETSGESLETFVMRAVEPVEVDL